MQSCPECGADRDGALRFCPNCGLDFWRVAAGQPSHPMPTPVVPAARSVSGGGPLGFIVAGIVLLLVAGGAVVVMSGVLPTGVPGGRPAPSVRQLTAEESLIHAFFREVRDPDAAYTVTYEGTTTYSGIADAPAPISMTGEARLNGDDWAGHEEYIQDGETILDADMVLLDDTGYLSEDDGDWVAGEIPERLQPISPFRRISTVTEVDYLTEGPLADRPQHTLLITKWLGGRDYSDILRPIARIESQVSRMEVVVDSFGVPSIAELEMTVVATDGLETLTINAVVTYRIDRWDDVGPIEPPRLPDGEASVTTTN
jgi:hypothetical protein